MNSSALDTLFDRALAVTFEQEGNGALSLDQHDAGNWTGGRVGAGVLRGTRWGFSAAAYPNLDIASLDRPHATGLAFVNYWLPAKCPSMPGRVAALMFDAAFQHGVPTASRMLQSVLGVNQDGITGPVTLAALVHAASSGVGPFCIRLQVERLVHMMEQPSWALYARGFSRRLYAVLLASEHVDGGSV